MLLLAAMLAQLISHRLPPSVFARALEYAGLGYVTLSIVLTARDGYRRRLPYWTRDSWRRYFRACAIPFGVLVAFLGLTAAQDYRLLVIHPTGQILRSVWIATMLLMLLASVWGLFKSISWLTDGDPSQQFTRLRNRPSRTAAST